MSLLQNRKPYVLALMIIVVAFVAQSELTAGPITWKNLLTPQPGWTDAVNWNASFPDPDYPNDIGASAIFPAWTNANKSIEIGMSKTITIGTITRDALLSNEDIEFKSGPLVFSGYGGISTVTVNHMGDDADTTFSCAIILSNNLEIVCTSLAVDERNRVHLNGAISGNSAISARSTGPSRSYLTMAPPASSYSGGLTVSNIFLELANQNGLGQGDLTVQDNVRIEFEGNATIANDIDYSSPTVSAQTGQYPVTLNGVISGAGDLTFETMSSAGEGASGTPIKLAGSNPNTCSGEVVLQRAASGTFPGDVVLDKDSALGSATLLTIGSNVCLTVTDGGASEDRIDDSAWVDLKSSGATRAKVVLALGVTETVGRLYFNNVPQRRGTWGSVSSGAVNANNDWFSGNGILNVLDTGMPKRSTLIMIR